MPNSRRTPSLVLLVLYLAPFISAQSSSGTISGFVSDQNNAAVVGASVLAVNVGTRFERSVTTDSGGRYRIADLLPGRYDIRFRAAGFATLDRKGVTVDSRQDVTLDGSLSPGDLQASVTVDANASALNTTTAEVQTRFDSRRLSELPTTPNRSIYGVLYSAAGVIQLSSGQTSFGPAGFNFSVNGGRVRSNNFQLDGQDVNDASLTGPQMPLSNPDAIQEVRIVTNQFLPEYGHNSASVVSIIGKSGTNDLKGSAFWFHNNERLNACSNLDKRAGFCNENVSETSKKGAPLRSETQWGFTLGGPVIFPKFGDGGSELYRSRDRTFFFADYQRWTDRRSPSQTLIGAPTSAGRAALEANVGDRAQVQALLRSVPAGTPNGRTATVQIPNRPSFSIELGDLTETAAFKFKSDQGSIRVDHSIDERNTFYARYRYSYESSVGGGQIVPQGLGTVDDRYTIAATAVLTSQLSSRVSNEARVAWKRFDLAHVGENADENTLPSIQIRDVGMIGPFEGPTRTGFGLGSNLPVYRINNTFQINDTVSIFRGDHSFKFGAEVRRADERHRLFSSERGSLIYLSLSDFVNDRAQMAMQSLPMKGGDVIPFYRWTEFYFFAQDQWKITRDLTLTYGVRYEFPGDSFKYLRDLNQRIVAANNNDPRFVSDYLPNADKNNWMPRVGFSWNPSTRSDGFVGLLTGGKRLVVRGGYARTYDPDFINIQQNIFPLFPFSVPPTVPTVGAFAFVTTNRQPIIPPNPLLLNTSGVTPGYRSPATDQLALTMQRELTTDLNFSIGWIRTRGTGLLQTMEENPRLPCLFGTGTGLCNTTGVDRNTGIPLPPGIMIIPTRRDPTRGQITLRTNSASSSYDALQTSLEKRLSRGVSFGLHYTFSAFIDTASDALGASSADLSVSQDLYDQRANRARSSFDRPHRLTGNIVYELPFFSGQRSFTGKLLGGWQVNSFFSMQSGAPITVFNGSDPAGTGNLNAMRPNVYSSLDLSSMSIADLHILNRSLVAAANAQAQQNLAALPPGPCTEGWLPGPQLPTTLFSAPRARVTCSSGVRNLVVEFNGIPEGQSIGNAGRNILRADGFANVDLGIIKNTRINEKMRAQGWIDFFNLSNSRNFGIPLTAINDLAFLDQWLTDGGSRRIRLGARIVF